VWFWGLLWGNVLGGGSMGGGVGVGYGWGVEALKWIGGEFKVEWWG